MNPFYKNLALWLVITLMMIMLYNLFNPRNMVETDIGYTDFLSMVEGEQIADVVIQGQELTVTDRENKRFKVYAPQDANMIEILRRKGVNIKSRAKPEAESPWYMVGLGVLVSHAHFDRGLDILHAPDAIGRGARRCLSAKAGRGFCPTTRPKSRSKTWRGSTKPRRNSARSWNF